MRSLLTFCAFLALGTFGVLGYAWIIKRPSLGDLHALTPGIWVTEQVTLEQIPGISRKFRSLVDLRPDGEAADQPTASQMRQSSATKGVTFSYVPVPHGAIPAGVVDALGRSLESSPQPVLLYCRSGKRAARTWALVEASRVGGLKESEIVAAVEAAGQPAGDLSAEIAARIAARRSAEGAAR